MIRYVISVAFLQNNKAVTVKLLKQLEDYKSIVVHLVETRC